MKRYKTIVLITTLLLIGCDDTHRSQDLQKYVGQLKEEAVLSKNKLAKDVVNLPKPMTYHSTSTRSPFDQASTQIKDNHNPLTIFSLSSLRFKGTISLNNETIAYIVTPENKVFQVKIGDIIGDHYGKIIHISPTSIEVEEKTSDSLNPAQRIVTLRLKGDH